MLSHLSRSVSISAFQDFAYLSLEPKALEIDMTGALSLEKIRVNVPSVFTVAIGTEKELRYVYTLQRLSGLFKDMRWWRCNTLSMCV